MNKILSFTFAAVLLGSSAPVRCAEPPPVPSAALPANKYSDSENSVYQYFFPEDPSDPSNRGGYYLWLPPGCKRVNGLFLAPKNMDELPFLQFGETRALCRELGLGIVIMMPSKTSPFVVDAFPEIYPDKKISGQKIFNYRQGACDFLQKLFDRMAEKTGYDEIKYAPVIPLGHSWAGAFPSHVAYGMPERVICSILLKTHLESNLPFDPGSTPSNRLKGVPVLLVDEQGGPNLGKSAGWDCWGFRQGKARSARKLEGDSLGNPISRLVPLGSAHCEMPKPMMHLMVEYVREACHRRLPALAPAAGPAVLKAIDIKDGWLMDDRLDMPASEVSATAAYGDYQGDRDSAIWYFNQPLAQQFEQYFRSSFEKKTSQCIAIIDPSTGQPCKESKMTVSSLADDQTFSVKSANVTATKSGWYAGVDSFGSSTTPTAYSVIMGELEQVGPDTFRVVRDRFGAGGCGRTIEADNFGDSQSQPSMASAQVAIEPVKDGASQKLVFPKIESITAGTSHVPLAATADSGLPIGYYVVYGPAVVEGDSLRITALPPRAKLPIEIKVAAYQWGRYGDKPVKGTEALFQTFLIVHLLQDLPRASLPSKTLL